MKVIGIMAKSMVKGFFCYLMVELKKANLLITSFNLSSVRENKENY